METTSRAGSFEFFSHFSDDLFLVLSVVKSGHTRHGLNTTHAGGNTGFGNDFEHTDVTGSLDVCTAAEFAAEVIDGDDADASPYFSPNKAMAPFSLASSIGISSMVTGIFLRISFVDQVFDSIEFGLGHGREMGKVKAQVVRRD